MNSHVIAMNASYEICFSNILFKALMVERVVRGDQDEEDEITWNLSTDVRYSTNKSVI